jgi:class 3 adenylate cyclase/tetratricopeptide (TPR) repeat protein
MKCPKCQFDNLEEMKFCGKCGAKLEKICPQCNFSNPSDFMFCGKCGYDFHKPSETPSIDYSEPQSYTPKFLADKILTTRSSLEGERKLVTVFFADVANYTSMAEKLDPEDVHQIMDGCFRILMDEIHNHEGTINQFTGDGVMALFGAPVAHENHSHRACYAALSIQDRLQEYRKILNRKFDIDFNIRIGLNSGQVVVGSIGNDLRMDYTAVGDTTNLAARMEGLAEPGSILVSLNTHKLVRYFFEFEPLGKIQVKGKDQPQEAYKLIRAGDVETRIEASLARGLTELVGRRPEIEILKTVWEKVKNSKGWVVDVVGEAGVGKSRLIYEFQKTIAEEANILTGICIHYGRSINFLPVIDMVRKAFGIEEGMSEQESGQRIKERASEILASMIPFYYNLLSLKTEDSKFNALNPEGRKFGTFEAVKDLLVNLSEERPLVVFLEDIHWMDKISEEFFNFFTHSIHGLPIMMLAAYRPEAEPPWTKGAHYRQLGLETLSGKSSVRLVRNILGDLELDPNLEEKVVVKTGGNPFFVEEMVRELLERGDVVQEGDRYVSQRPIDQLDIPNSVQGVLAARMDRLSEDLKRTMQVASVIGREFAYKILYSIIQLRDEVRTHLTNLVGIEVLYEKALYPELEYIFKHTLTREVAYESLLKQRRQEIHGRIARTIEELYADRLEQHYELLAHHWEFSDSPDRAIEYLILAGEKSNQSQAASAAVDFFTRVLNQIERSEKHPDPNLMIRIKQGRGNPLHAMGRIEESLADYRDAIRLARRIGDRQMELECLTEVPLRIWNTTFKDQLPDFCDQGLKLARKLKDKGAEAKILTAYSFWRATWYASDEYKAIQHAFGLARESGQPATVMLTAMVLALTERVRGAPQRCLKLTEGMVEMLQSAFNIYVTGNLSFVRGMALTEAGRYSEAIELLGRQIDIMERNTIYIHLGRLCNTLGWTYSEVYNFEKARDLNKRSLEYVIMLRRSPAMLFWALEMQSQTEINLMENKYAMGKVNEAWEHLTRYEKVSSHPDYDYVRWRWSIRLKDLKGTILLRRGDLNGAEKLARECLDVATRDEMRKYMGRAERLLGRTLTERGAYDQADSKLKSALTNLEEVGNPKQLWLTHTALAKLHEKMNRHDLKQNHWQAAASVIKSTADDLEDKELRKTFINAKPVREILDNANR